MHQIDQHAKSRLRRPLRRPRLQKIERAVLNGELDILHVAEMALQARGPLFKRGGSLRQALLEILRMAQDPAPGNDVLALRVEEKIDVKALGSRRRVAREGNASAGSVRRRSRTPSLAP